MKYLSRYLLLSIVMFLQFNASAFGGAFIKARYVIRKDQLPAAIIKYKADYNYLIYSGGIIADSITRKTFISGDTITHLDKFLKTVSKTAEINFRLIFINDKGQLASLSEFDKSYGIIKKITADFTNEEFALYKIFRPEKDVLIEKEAFSVSYSSAKMKAELFSPVWYSNVNFDEIIFDNNIKKEVITRSAWVLSVGNNDYGTTKFEAGEKDAIAYAGFFKEQFIKKNGAAVNFHSYLLTGKAATKDSIITALKEIAARAGLNDYFVFNFSGMSLRRSRTDKDTATFFVPYNVVLKDSVLINRSADDKKSMSDNLISLKEMQEYIQQIPADNQLFISEAGYSDKFRIEFVRSLMQNSAVASILNKNRVIITPNGFGMERPDIDGAGVAGILENLITHLNPAYNIYNIFGSERFSSEIVNDLRKRLYDNDKITDKNYFDVFFEKKFLQDYRDIFGNSEGLKRGITLEAGELKKAGKLNGKRYALVLGTDNYKGNGWVKLANPIYDATEVADQLHKNYGFEVTLLKDATMDEVYGQLGDFYRKLHPEDQFIFFVAGHGDFEQGLLDDGFIVCSDSRSVAEDPMRNTYIQHSKLKKMINKMPARQVLVMLDICFGGTFDEQVLGKTRDNTNEGMGNANVIQYLEEKSAYQTRKVLSSAGKEPAFDGRAGKHSPFTNLLLQVLSAKGRGTNGLVTLSNIFDVLQTASLNETETLRITPHKASFGNDEALGEFILIPNQLGSP